MVPTAHFFECLEVSDTKKDPRNGFFSEFWSYDNSGFSIRSFMLMMSSLAFVRYVSEQRI